MASACNSIYSRRKRFLPEYRKLFEVLLKIPDEDVRRRVTDAINGVSMCSVCKKKDTREFGTQTENIVDSTSDLFKAKEIEMTDKHEDNSKQTFEKKRRKRKRTCPKVVKTAQLASNTPVLKQDTAKSPKIELPSKVIRPELEDLSLELSIDSIASCESLSTDNIQKQMKIEYETCFKYCGGLLPIHQAITKNDLKKLRRQIYVFNFLKTNLMELITDDDYNVIQLAVAENCYKFIIEELLNQETIHLKDVDNEHNTIIHLAVTHLSSDDDVHQQKSMLESFELLLRKFDLGMLREKNNDGMTALHLAVRKDKYLMVETMLRVIDDMLHIESVDPIKETNPNKKAFIEHYNKKCDNFEGRQLNKLKSEILNATDMKSGCTALYFAMEKKYDHIIYLLLAHMCDPSIKNLAGIDPKTYYSDYGGNAIIVGTLDKVMQVLQKQNNS